LGIGGDSDKMFRDGSLLTVQAGQHPLARGMRVCHRFQCGECLGGDNEQCLGGIEIAYRLGEIRAIDIGH
jgi:hypothetical protein